MPCISFQKDGQHAANIGIGLCHGGSLLEPPNCAVAKIPWGLGKIDAQPRELAEAVEASGFLELPVSAAHAAGVAALAPHHHDPFDRLLIAQALAEPLRLLTADPMLANYSNVVITV